MKKKRVRSKFIIIAGVATNKGYVKDFKADNGVITYAISSNILEAKIFTEEKATVAYNHLAGLNLYPKKVKIDANEIERKKDCSECACNLCEQNATCSNACTLCKNNVLYKNVCNAYGSISHKDLRPIKNVQLAFVEDNPLRDKVVNELLNLYAELSKDWVLHKQNSTQKVMQILENTIEQVRSV